MNKKLGNESGRKPNAENPPNAPRAAIRPKERIVGAAPPANDPKRFRSKKEGGV